MCSKVASKSFQVSRESSDAYIGLCTLFFSLLAGNKFKIAELLGVPFDVIAFQQARLDSELSLLIGIIENDFSVKAKKTGKGNRLVTIDFFICIIFTAYLDLFQMAKPTFYVF